jgi:hypothetical protein
VAVPAAVLPTAPVTVAAANALVSHLQAQLEQATARERELAGELARQTERAGWVEGEVKGVREALAEARRPWWKKALGL